MKNPLIQRLKSHDVVLLLVGLTMLCFWPNFGHAQDYTSFKKPRWAFPDIPPPTKPDYKCGIDAANSVKNATGKTVALRGEVDGPQGVYSKQWPNWFRHKELLGRPVIIVDDKCTGGYTSWAIFYDSVNQSILRKFKSGDYIYLTCKVMNADRFFCGDVLWLKK